MHYVTEALDRATGELVTTSLGDWLTVTEVGRLHGAGPRRTRQILVHMGFLAPEGRRHRLPLDHVAKGWGKRLVRKATGQPFDTISPEGQRLIAAAWADTVADLEAEERGEPEIEQAASELEAFVEDRAEGLDTDGRVRWLVDHFPDLDPRQLAHIVGISRQLVERYKARRSAQISALKARLLVEVSQRPPTFLKTSLRPPSDASVDPAWFDDADELFPKAA